MKSNNEQFIKDSNTENHFKSIKKLKANIIIPIIIIIIINTQCFILLFCNLKVRDEIISTYKKKEQINDINSNIQSIKISIQEEKLKIQGIAKVANSRKNMQKNLNDLIKKAKESQEFILKNLEKKKYYDNLSQSITSMLSPLYLEVTESMTNCTFISNCYRMSRDGYSAKAFHMKCDGKKPTVALVKSSKGEIFGGITHAYWDSNGLKYDSKAYLLSIILNVKYHLKENKPAINTAKYLLPTFGVDDIYISETEAYVKKPMESYGNITSNIISKSSFILVEIEVYHMKCDN